MTEEFSGHNSSGLPDEDKMGFAVPKTPTHSLMLLNSYMRTDMLQHIHSRLHKMRDMEGSGSPLHQMAKTLEEVVDTWGDVNLFECFTRIQYHIDPDYELQPEQDYLHDIRLVKHHLKSHRKTIKEMDRWS